MVLFGEGLGKESGYGEVTTDWLGFFLVNASQIATLLFGPCCGRREVFIGDKGFRSAIATIARHGWDGEQPEDGES